MTTVSDCSVVKLRLLFAFSVLHMLNAAVHTDME